MAKGLSDDELIAITDSEIRNSVAYMGGKLSEQRRKAEYYYLGLPKGDLSPPDIEGRSSVVSTDVRNTIEWMRPALMAKFVSGDNVVEFEATKPGDEDKAQAATDYINYLFFKKNNGYQITHDAFHDALTQKKGILKVWWDQRHEEKREEYKGLTEIELGQLLEDDEVEPIEQNIYHDEEDHEQREQAIHQLELQAEQAQMAGDMQAVQQIAMQIQQVMQSPPKMLYDVAVKRVKKGGKLTIENVPPDEFLICRDAKDIETARFVAHRVQRTLSDLKSVGYKNVDNLASDDAAASYNAERIERLSYDNEMAYLNESIQSQDDSQKTIWVTECYLRADRDGDGISELVKIVRAGNQILDEEIVDCAPFVDFDCVKLPHKFWGLSIADLAMESQRIKTNVMRAALDNLYLQVNGRYFAVEGQVNLDDLLTSRPGGVVRIKNPGSVGSLDQARGDGASALQMVEQMDNFLENSTGWTRYSQGTDSDSLNKTATGVLTVTNRADMRVDLIARNFANGFEKLFRMMLKLVLQNQDGDSIAKINGKFTKISPREWINQFDVSINVGLGTGDKTQQAQSIMQILQVQREAIQIGVANPQGIYEATKELAKAIGFKNGDKFFIDPSKQPPQPQKQDPLIQVEQMKQQGEQAKIQATIQLEREKTQLEMQQAQFQAYAEADKKDQELRLQTELELVKANHSKELELLKIDAMKELEMFKAKLQAETQIIVAELKANSSLTAQMNQAADAASSDV